MEFIMITFYAIPVSLYCAKLRILLHHKSLDWQELPPPGGYGSDAYKKVVASGNLPALIAGDVIIADSEAIAEYLNEIYPDYPMLPDDPLLRAKMRERSRFHDTRLEPEVRALFPYIAPDQRDQRMIGLQSKKVAERLTQFARMLTGNNEVEDEFGLGDCGFAITFVWLEALSPLLGLNIIWPMEVHNYRERINKIPAVHTELEIYRPLLNKYLKQRTKK